MTLVVSDISRYGIIMVGDSAVTLGTSVKADAFKVQYAKAANVGFALWGNAGVDHRRIDYWLADFIRDQVKTGDSVQDVGERLVSSLNAVLEKSGRKWKDLVRGIHIAGYREALPVLFHAHCGHPNEPAHEMRLYHDYPDDQKWSEDHFRSLLNYGFIHLRNGYHPLFGPLFKQALDYAAQLRAAHNIQFPHPSLEGRFEFYKLLVRFVAGTLVASKIHPGVNDELSAIAFDDHGMVIDQQLPIVSPTKGGSSAFDEFFEEANQSVQPLTLGSTAEPMAEQIPCPKCGVALPEPSRTATAVQCGQCRAVLFFQPLEESLTFRGSLFRRARSPGKANYQIQREEGESFFRRTGRWHDLTRIIDRVGRRYYKHIEDAETGEVIDHKDKPLPEHRRPTHG